MRISKAIVGAVVATMLTAASVAHAAEFTPVVASADTDSKGDHLFPAATWVLIFVATAAGIIGIYEAVDNGQSG